MPDVLKGGFGEMRFRFSPIPTVLALIGVVVTILLGNWQTGRAHEKEALQAAMDRAAADAPLHLTVDSPFTDKLYYHRIEAKGHFLAAHTIFLDNRLRAGVPGYEVVTPFALSRDKALLVNRGWVAAGSERSRLPQVSTSESEISIVGLALPPTAKYVELSNHTIAGSVWQNLDIKRFVERTGLVVLPMVVQLYSDVADGLSRQWPRPDMRIDTHRAYALQWYTMSVAIFLLYFFLNVRRR